MEDVKILGVGKADVLPLAFLDAREDPVGLTRHGYDHFAVIRVDAGDGAETGGLTSQIGSKWWRQRRSYTDRSVGTGHPYSDPVDAVTIGVEGIIAEFKADVQIDNHAGKHAQGE